MVKIDFHVHINGEMPIERAVRNLRDMMERHGYSSIGIMSLLYYGNGGSDPGCNARALELKRRIPGSFAFASLSHSDDFAAQARRFMSEGFDGIKLLEGKPSMYRRFGYGIDDTRFDGFFDYAQREQIPILLHSCDPARNWDADAADERALRMGWVYGRDMPPQQSFFAATERVLEKYPRLRITLAHMGFYSDNLEHAQALLDTYPNLRFDITPALIIYEQLSMQQNARQFFIKNASRLIYGTDAEYDLCGFSREYNDKKVRVITAFLEGSGECTADGIRLCPLDLPKNALEMIYGGSALRFVTR